MADCLFVLGAHQRECNAELEVIRLDGSHLVRLPKKVFAAETSSSTDFLSASFNRLIEAIYDHLIVS